MRKIFVRLDSNRTPRLAQLLQVGGRGGGVALKLYLALLWRCSSEPYQTSKPHRAWATLLGLEEPEGKGARRVAAALKTLEGLGLVSVRRVPAEPNVVQLLDESGDGSEYAPPSTEYARAPKGEVGDARRARNVYFKVPSKLWLEGHIQSLDAPGLAMLLILLAEQADIRPVWFSTDVFPQRYCISQKSRAAGTLRLVERNLLRVERQPLSEFPGQTSVFDRKRSRKLYNLAGAAAEGPAPEAAAETGPKPARQARPARLKTLRRPTRPPSG
ncbi:hypothetical protein ASD16_11980 [Cellulomonas sp. Root485]|uniref:hypothetical protein n=1 Tax=Cellulomonas sp. Root485 TaxID=1736546 RepID=UPI0006FDC660|nr:hypothetical protein [Cellulomonas sp. Root485]KQY23267.1 hypothetical protein ASD16_11980 [Cellulomonas sp. Root485]